MAAPKRLDNDIRKFEEIGTHPAANHNAISEALTFHESIGVERKAARLRYLRDRWAQRLARLPQVKILHSPDPAQSCGLGCFGLEGVDPAKLVATLWEKHGILVTPMSSDEYRAVRVTANIYTTLEEIDTFCMAVEKTLA
jgi:selenocysteine lyase/cysteine desulfurase